jgi:formylglycine-generating enzyme required for sulfatase activity
MKKGKLTMGLQRLSFAILVILFAFVAVVSCDNGFVIAILPSRDSGAKKEYTILLDIRGKGAGDNVTVSPKTGNGGDTITLAYTLANTAHYNLLDLGGVTSPIASVNGAGKGTRTYTVNPDDASNKVITITAVFEHTNLELDPIAFATTGHITKTYGDAPFTNAVKGGYKGSGAITYSSSDTTVATVNGSGQVTILRVGSTVIIAEKAADAVYAYAQTNYTLTVNFIDMVHIPAGTFTMGSPTSEPNRNSDETQHSVTLTKSFYMGKYQVTQEQWEIVMKKTILEQQALATTSTTDYGRGANYPIYYVNWYEALVFCNKLSVMEGLSSAYRISGSTDPAAWGTVPTSSNATWNAVEIVAGSTGYRLPTEAQWEYACRAGTTTAYNTGSTISDNTGWYSSNSGSKTHEVGKKSVNAFGLYDMHGNVYEWCWDWYDSGYYSSNPTNDPMGASSGSFRVLRGGGWIISAGPLRSAYRNSDNPNDRSYYVGFRLIRP